MQINKLLTKINLTRANNTGRIKYIVIHYVGATGGAKANCQYYASQYVGASAHYYVDFDGSVWQSVEDKDIAWHCGAKRYKHPECRNSNSLGIELCVRNKGSKADTSRDWYFEDATVASAIQLTRDLMARYHVPASHVIRHYDVTGKICPNPYVYNHTKHTWQSFKAQISGGSAPAQSSPVQNSSGKIILKVDGLWGGDTTQRLQHYFGLSQDRTISNQLNAYKRYCPGIVSVQWSNTPNGGSQLVRKMQAWLGIAQDGYIGQEFCKALQCKFGKVQDGVLSHPSQCITALQAWLNQQT